MKTVTSLRKFLELLICKIFKEFCLLLSISFFSPKNSSSVCSGNVKVFLLSINMKHQSEFQHSWFPLKLHKRKHARNVKLFNNSGVLPCVHSISHALWSPSPGWQGYNSQCPKCISWRWHCNIIILRELITTLIMDITDLLIKTVEHTQPPML